MYKPKLQFVQTGRHMPEYTHPKMGANVKWGSLLKSLSVDHYRNEFIVEKLTAQLKDGRKSIVVADHMSLVELLFEKFSPRGSTVARFDGKVPEVERFALHERLRQGEIHLLIASPLIDPIVDLIPIPHFNTLDIVTPTSARFSRRLRLVHYMTPEVPVVVNYYVDENAILQGIYRKHLKWASKHLTEWDVVTIEREDKP